MKGRKKGKVSFEQSQQIRKEYMEHKNYTAEYMADKYDMSTGAMYKILTNQSHTDHNYTYTSQKDRSIKNNKSKLVYLPDHIREAKDELVPIAQTLHRARGQNRTINKFS